MPEIKGGASGSGGSLATDAAWTAAGQMAYSTGVATAAVRPELHVKSFALSGTTYYRLPGVVPISASTYATGGADRSLYQWHWFDRDCTITDFAVECTTLAASSAVQVLIYAMGSDGNPTGAQVGASASLDTTTTGVKTSTGHSISVTRGPYVFQVINTGGNPTLRMIVGNVPGLYIVRDTITATPTINEPRQIGTTAGGAITNVTAGGGLFGTQYTAFVKVA